MKNAFEPHCESTLLLFQFHLLLHIIQDLKRFGSSSIEGMVV